MTNRGGFRCRHHWQAVDPDWLETPEEIDTFNKVQEPPAPEPVQESKAVQAVKQKKAAEPKPSEVEDPVDTWNRRKDEIAAGGKPPTTEQVEELGSYVRQHVDKNVEKSARPIEAKKKDIQDKRRDIATELSSIPKEEWKGNKRVNELRMQAEALREEESVIEKTLRETKQRATLESVNKFRDFGPGGGVSSWSASNAISLEDEKIIADAQKFIPRDWLSNAKPKMGIGLGADRASYHPKDDTMSIPGVGQIMGSNELSRAKQVFGQEGTTLHEFMHRVELTTKEVSRQEASFFAARVKASPPESRVKKWLGPPFDQREVGIEDKWPHPYMGKDYSVEFKGLIIPSQSHEIMSMMSPAAFRYDDELWDLCDDQLKNWTMGMLTSL